MSNKLVIDKKDIQFYIVNPDNAVIALNNYQKNKRVDRYLELSKTKEITIKGKTYKRKDYLNHTEYKVLYGLQRDIERISSKLNIVNMTAQSINRKLQNHGDKLTPADIKACRTQWEQLSKEYDLTLTQIEKKTDEAREKTLAYTFKIPKDVFDANYMELLDYADGIYLSIINLYDKTDDTTLGDVIKSLTGDEIADPMSNVVNPNIFDAVSSNK